MNLQRILERVLKYPRLGDHPVWTQPEVGTQATLRDGQTDRPHRKIPLDPIVVPR
jgi:hypothetical protein